MFRNLLCTLTRMSSTTQTCFRFYSAGRSSQSRCPSSFIVLIGGSRSGLTGSIFPDYPGSSSSVPVPNKGQQQSPPTRRWGGRVGQPPIYKLCSFPREAGISRQGLSSASLTQWRSCLGGGAAGDSSLHLLTQAAESGNLDFNRTQGKTMTPNTSNWWDPVIGPSSLTLSDAFE